MRGACGATVGPAVRWRWRWRGCPRVRRVRAAPRPRRVPSRAHRLTPSDDELYQRTRVTVLEPESSNVMFIEGYNNRGFTVSGDLVVGPCAILPRAILQWNVSARRRRRGCSAPARAARPAQCRRCPRRLAPTGTSRMRVCRCSGCWSPASVRGAAGALRCHSLPGWLLSCAPRGQGGPAPPALRGKELLSGILLL